MFRNYFVRHQSGQRGQLETQINLLDAITNIPIVNGYVSYDPRQHAPDVDDAQNEIDQVKVGIHQGVQAVNYLKTLELTRELRDRYV